MKLLTEFPLKIWMFQVKLSLNLKEKLLPKFYFPLSWKMLSEFCILFRYLMQFTSKTDLKWHCWLIFQFLFLSQERYNNHFSLYLFAFTLLFTERAFLLQRMRNNFRWSETKVERRQEDKKKTLSGVFLYFNVKLSIFDELANKLWTEKYF